MTATITTITRDMPDPTGTNFVRDDDLTGHETAFSAREPGFGDIDFTPLSAVLEEGYPARRAENAKALRKIALEILTEPRLTNPNVRYAKPVHSALLDRLHDADLITTGNYDEITLAFDVAVEYAALAIATGWLHERGSLPIPTETSIVEDSDA